MHDLKPDALSRRRDMAGVGWPAWRLQVAPPHDRGMEMDGDGVGSLLPAKAAQDDVGAGMMELAQCLEMLATPVSGNLDAVMVALRRGR